MKERTSSPPRVGRGRAAAGAPWGRRHVPPARLTGGRPARPSPARRPRGAEAARVAASDGAAATQRLGAARGGHRRRRPRRPPNRAAARPADGEAKGGRGKGGQGLLSLSLSRMSCATREGTLRGPRRPPSSACAPCAASSLCACGGDGGL
eukprot:scaffold1243_cov403-Prasinococcus_capsulatus_cf.AAC.32